MPQFIHLTDQKDIVMIRKNGIKAQKVYGPCDTGVYATPVLPDYYLSHQWVRELKRKGIRTISAIQFRIDDAQLVWVGHYNEDHLHVPASEAVQIFIEHEPSLGLEIIIPASIPAKSITRVYTPSQVSGWRYYPESHSDGRTPCGCSYCQRGQIKNRKLRQAYEGSL